MDELERRRRQLADPENHLKSLGDTPIEQVPQDSLNHLKAEQLFESQMSQAMQVDVPNTLPENVLLAQRLRRRNSRMISWAMAASVLAFSFFGIFRFNQSQLPLFQQALAHIYGELDQLEETGQVSQAQLLARLGKMSMALPGLPEKILFARRCGFAGENAMHIIAEIDGKPVSLLVTNVPVTDNMRFGDERFVGQMRSFGLNNIIAIAEDLSLVDRLLTQLSDA